MSVQQAMDYNLMKTLYKIKSLIVIIILFIGCSTPQKAIVKKTTFVMKEPYPISYTHIQNRILDTITIGDTIEVLDSSYAKDFQYFKIRIRTTEGYIFSRKVFSDLIIK